MPENCKKMMIFAFFALLNVIIEGKCETKKYYKSRRGFYEKNH